MRARPNQEKVDFDADIRRLHNAAWMLYVGCSSALDTHAKNQVAYYAEMLAGALAALPTDPPPRMRVQSSPVQAVITSQFSALDEVIPLTAASPFPVRARFGLRRHRQGASQQEATSAQPTHAPGDSSRSAGAGPFETGRWPCNRRLTSWPTTASPGGMRFTAARYTTVPE